MELDRQHCVAIRALYAMLEGPLPQLIGNHGAHAHENHERARLWELFGGRLQTNYRTVIRLNSSTMNSGRSVVFFPALEAWRDQSRLPVKIVVPQIRLKVMFHMTDHMPEWSIYQVFVTPCDADTTKLFDMNTNLVFDIVTEPK